MLPTVAGHRLPSWGCESEFGKCRASAHGMSEIRNLVEEL
jgi:hypothetical protein